MVIHADISARKFLRRIYCGIFHKVMGIGHSKVYVASVRGKISLVSPYDQLDIYASRVDTHLGIIVYYYYY